MKRFLSNYVVTADGKVLNNGLVTVADDGTLLSMSVIDGERPAVRYVDCPLLVLHHADEVQAHNAVAGVADLAELCRALANARLETPVIGQLVTLIPYRF